MPSSNPPLVVVGGTYRESCAFPRYNEVYGSGLRAASALGSSGTPTHFRTVCSSELERHARLKAATFGFAMEATRSGQDHSFWYLHTLAGGELSPRALANRPLLEIEADCVLQFGLVEADATVLAKRLIYDPQSPSSARSLRSTGSKADRVAVVLNRREALLLSAGGSPAESARKIRTDEAIEVVVVKDGPRGAFVCTNDRETWVPVFVTPKCFLIGSGDVFSAIFAREWGFLGKDPVTAATVASLATAAWCNSLVFPLNEDAVRRSAAARTIGTVLTPPKVYLAGPFFCASRLWWVAHARNVLVELGFSVFSPYHDIGVASLANDEIAKRDIEALKTCDVVFALLDGLDPGTLFEIGVARTHGIPVVGLRTEGPFGFHETMLQGTGCALFDDFGSAAYHAYWTALSKMR